MIISFLDQDYFRCIIDNVYKIRHKVVGFRIETKSEKVYGGDHAFFPEDIFSMDKVKINRTIDHSKKIIYSTSDFLLDSTRMPNISKPVEIGNIGCSLHDISCSIENPTKPLIKTVYLEVWPDSKSKESKCYLSDRFYIMDDKGETIEVLKC